MLGGCTTEGLGAGLGQLTFDRLGQTPKLPILQTSGFTQVQKSPWALKGPDLVGKEVKWCRCVSR